jgi:hypothetical protein
MKEKEKEKEKECSVCAKAASSYKCAHCRTPYCSVTCYKAHKDICSKVGHVAVHKPELEGARGSSDSAGLGGTVTATRGRDAGAIILHESQLAALDKDPELQKLLRSERLRAHIQAVDAAPDRARALKRLRLSHPDFDGFVAKTVSVVSSRDLQTGADELRRAAQDARKAAVARLVEEARLEAARLEGQEAEEGLDGGGEGDEDEEEGEGEGEGEGEDEEEDEGEEER